MFFSFSVFSNSSLYACVHVCACVCPSHRIRLAGGCPTRQRTRAPVFLHRNTRTSLLPSILTLCYADSLSHTLHPHLAVWGALLMALSMGRGGGGAGAPLVISRQSASLSLSSVHVLSQIPLADVLRVFCHYGSNQKRVNPPLPITALAMRDFQDTSFSRFYLCGEGLAGETRDRSVCGNENSS